MMDLFLSQLSKSAISVTLPKSVKLTANAILTSLFLLTSSAIQAALIVSGTLYALITLAIPTV